MFNLRQCETIPSESTETLEKSFRSFLQSWGDLQLSVLTLFHRATYKWTFASFPCKLYNLFWLFGMLFGRIETGLQEETRCKVPLASILPFWRDTSFHALSPALESKAATEHSSLLLFPLQLNPKSYSVHSVQQHRVSFKEGSLKRQEPGLQDTPWFLFPALGEITGLDNLLSAKLNWPQGDSDPTNWNCS